MLIIYIYGIVFLIIVLIEQPDYWLKSEIDGLEQDPEFINKDMDFIKSSKKFN